MSGCNSQRDAGRKAQFGKQSANSIERHLRKSGIGPQLGKYTAICHDHLGYRCVSAGEFGQHKFKRFPDQRKAVPLRRERQPEFGKNGAMALKDQCAAIDQRPVKVEHNQLHSITSSTRVLHCKVEQIGPRRLLCARRRSSSVQSVCATDIR